MVGQVTGLFFATMVDRYAPLDIRDFANGDYTDNQNGVFTCFYAKHDGWSRKVRVHFSEFTVCKTGGVRRRRMNHRPGRMQI